MQVEKIHGREVKLLRDVNGGVVFEIVGIEQNDQDAPYLVANFIEFPGDFVESDDSELVVPIGNRVVVSLVTGKLFVMPNSTRVIPYDGAKITY
jgi:hypothetical protein